MNYVKNGEKRATKCAFLKGLNDYESMKGCRLKNVWGIRAMGRGGMGDIIGGKRKGGKKNGEIGGEKGAKSSILMIQKRK